MQDTLLLSAIPTPENTNKIIEFPGENDDINIETNSRSLANIYSCTTYKFFNTGECSIHITDILNLISKYYNPKQKVYKNIKENICSGVSTSLVHKFECHNIPIPSDKIENAKSYPSLCPYFSQHLTLEFLFWVLLILFFKMGGPNIGSFIVLIIFYLLIQFGVWLNPYCNKGDGFYRYKHIFSVPLYNKDERVKYFNEMFDKSPTITFNLGLHDGNNLADMGWDSITENLNVKECSTFIKPDIVAQNENEYSNWFYCVGYETDIDFIDEKNKLMFESLCIRFINKNINENLSYHSFDVKIHNFTQTYNKKYWSGYAIIVNCQTQFSVYCVRFFIRILNLLCLSLLYKISLFFIKQKRIKIIKYIGFGA